MYVSDNSTQHKIDEPSHELDTCGCWSVACANIVYMLYKHSSVYVYLVTTHGWRMHINSNRKTTTRTARPVNVEQREPIHTNERTYHPDVIYAPWRFSNIDVTSYWSSRMLIRLCSKRCIGFSDCAMWWSMIEWVRPHGLMTNSSNSEIRFCVHIRRMGLFIFINLRMAWSEVRVCLVVDVLCSTVGILVWVFRACWMLYG